MVCSVCLSDVPGVVLCMSLRSLHGQENVGSWKAVIGLSTADHSPGCNHMIEMKITEELLKGKQNPLPSSSFFRLFHPDFFFFFISIFFLKVVFPSNYILA